jgi:hypothetical protein
MAATNFTPIQLYFSTTASAVPLAANLAQGELAINITDGKLYYEDNAGVVQVIATKGAGTIGGSNTQIQYNNNGALAGNAAMTFNSATSTTTLTTLNLTNALGAIYGGTSQSAYTQGDFLYASATNTLSKLGIGAVNYILTSTGSVPQWAAPSSITVNTATNLAGGAAGSVPYQSGVATTTFLAIGAADRVMTSTGTAPQWVTALTGLTGVSSSSITNTSLTSGRVVLSTTAGLQADSANLTFNGTTLSATGFSTTGLSTLVQTVTVGNSNFSGTAVFAAATPAKLYIGTGTVTDATSAIGATNTTGAISSLGITPIAATNTTVTYTNASTLYIAGAPSAGTNITITNPYALYVAAGAAYFGGAVTFAGSASLAGLTLSGNLLFSPDNTYDIGASGATRARTLYLGTSLITPAITNSGLTTGRVVYTTTGGLETSSANLLYSGGDLTIYGITAGRGANAIATNTVFGTSSLSLVTIGAENTAFGYNAGGRVTSGNYNVLLGKDAGQYVTTGNYNIFIGVGSGTTSANPLSGVTAVGSNTGKVVTGRDNTFLGANAGEALTSGTQNVFVGTYNQTLTTGSGGKMTIGSANAIFGNFNGNQNSLDIRTASNWTVLSDGDGNPRFVVNGSTTAASLPGSSGVYNSSSGTFDSSLQIGSNTQLMSFQNGTTNTQTQLASNTYYNGGYKAIAGGAGASKLFIGGPGTFEFSGASTLTNAGDAIAFTKTLDCAGLAFSIALQNATSVTGTGITFPATQFASSNANTLDDYEEGTWTPTFLSSVNPTYTFSSAIGTYTKIGRMVTLSLRFAVATASGGSGSTLQIGGFPFVADSAAGNSYSGIIGWNQQGSWSVNQPFNWEVQSSAAAAYLHYLNFATGGTYDLTPSALVAGATFEGSITYAASA